MLERRSFRATARDFLLAMIHGTQKRRTTSIRRNTSSRIEHLEDRTLLAATFSEFIDPNPAPGNRFGHSVVPLSTGNVVITSPYDDAGGTDAGAVYLFNGNTGELISTITGSSSYQDIGRQGVVSLSNGNYVILSYGWDHGEVSHVGAVTWGDGYLGVSGVVSPDNSLIGSESEDMSSNEVIPLANGNYVVVNPWWDNGEITDAGAVTWGNGNTGVFGEINSENSLIGSSASDYLGRNGVVALNNGNYVIASPFWDKGNIVNVGAATWGNGNSGTVGTVSLDNSLIGVQENDFVGAQVTNLSNGNYVVQSYNWSNGNQNEGAVTWGNGILGTTGEVSAQNSLTGTHQSDLVGNSGVTPLTNGNYVVTSVYWNGGRGAVTWMDGSMPYSGEVSSSNSLIGTQGGAEHEADLVGWGGVTALDNGNYVVRSHRWYKDGNKKLGAITWGNGTTGVSGELSSSNSLVGTTSFGSVGFNGIQEIDYDTFAVLSDNSITWGNASAGITGEVSSENSLIGANAWYVFDGADDSYLISWPGWSNGETTQQGDETAYGAVTQVTSTTGVMEDISINNSLVGTSEWDWVGEGFFKLPNGNYIVYSPVWNSYRGSTTWIDGSKSPPVGGVNSSNSLVGDIEYSEANRRLTVLPNGNYIITTPAWGEEESNYTGAVTMGNGATGSTGVISESNSIIGIGTSNNLQTIVIDNFNDTFYARFLNEAGGKVRVGSQVDAVNPVVAGSEAADAFEVSRDEDDLVVLKNDVEVFRQAIAGVESLEILGGDGDDELVIDLSDDIGIPISFDGQGQDMSAGGDTLTITGDGTFTRCHFQLRER